jgi:hypothetical protein
VRTELLDGDLVRVGDLQHAGFADGCAKGHLVEGAATIDEVHGRVHVRAGMHAHRDVGDSAVVAAAGVHHPLDHDGRVVGPVRHPVAHGDGHVDPVGGVEQPLASRGGASVAHRHSNVVDARADAIRS